jgi:hypothetical protein
MAESKKKNFFLRRKTATQSINRKAAKAIESSTSCRVVVYEIIIGSMIIVNGKFFPFFFSSLKCWNVIFVEKKLSRILCTFSHISSIRSPSIYKYNRDEENERFFLRFIYVLTGMNECVGDFDFSYAEK